MAGPCLQGLTPHREPNKLEPEFFLHELQQNVLVPELECSERKQKQMWSYTNRSHLIDARTIGPERRTTRNNRRWKREASADSYNILGFSVRHEPLVQMLDYFKGMLYFLLKIMTWLLTSIYI